MKLKNLLFLLKGGGILKKSPPSSPQSPGIQRQLEIYRKGILGRKPRYPIRLEELKAKARSVLSREAYDYVAGGAGSESSMRANRQAFDRWQIIPRMLNDVSTRDLSVKVFGQSLRYPFLLAPIGVQSIVHKEAEVAVARAAAALNVPLVLSTASLRTLEDVAAAMGYVRRWYQLYWPKDPELVRSFIKRAEAAGYTALVVTLDTTLLSWRERDIQNAFLPFLAGEGLANYFSDPVFRSALEWPPEEFPIGAVRHFAQVFSNPAMTWNDLKWLRKQTDLPIVVNDHRQRRWLLM